ncbi:MAG: hypothetical protein K6G85_00180 [Eubacterium sp.]|nr:hypothetical protein [Eubacterium sp.]
MRLPELNNYKSKQSTIGEFLGLQKNRTQMNEKFFEIAKNISHDYYPSIGSCRRKKIVGDMENVLGYCTTADGIYYVAKTNGTVHLYYNGKIVKNSQNQEIVTGLVDSTKQMVLMGAYLIVLPDKKMYNVSEKTCANMSFDFYETSLGPIRFYLSDENGNPFVVLPETAENANIFLENNQTTRQHDSAIKNILSDENKPFHNLFPDYVESFTSSYDSGDDLPLKKCQLVTGSKALAISGNQVTSYDVYLGEKDKEYGFRLKKYSASTSTWSEPKLYVTLWIHYSSLPDSLKKSIKKGDFIKVDFLNNNGNVITSGKKSYLNFFEKFGKYVEVINVVQKNDDIGFVISNSGLNYQKVIVDTVNSIKWGNYGSQNELITTIYSGYFCNGVPGLDGAGPVLSHAIKIYKDMPDLDYITVSNNRLWGVSNDKHEVYACKLGDPTNWHVFKGISSDSYTATIGSSGDFTGACTYNDCPVFFKDNRIITWYGTRPSNYQLDEIECDGIKEGCDKSIAYIDGNMFYVSPRGIMRYSGSFPTLVSKNLGDNKLFNAKAAGVNGRYFVSCKDQENVKHLYTYDISTGIIWENTTQEVDGLIAVNNNMYAVIDNQLVFLEGKNTPELFEDYDVADFGEEEWYLESGDIIQDIVNKAVVQRLFLSFELNKGAWVRVSIKYDNEKKWTKVVEKKSEQKQTFNIRVMPKRCEKIKLKFEGKGGFVLYQITRTIKKAGEI